MKGNAAARLNPLQTVAELHPLGGLGVGLGEVGGVEAELGGEVG